MTDTARRRPLVALKPYVQTSSGARAWSRWLPLLVALFAAFYGFAYALFATVFMLQFTLPLLLLVLLAIWALPASRTAPTRLLTGLFFAYFVARVLWPNYLALSLPGLPWITLVRIIAAPLLLVMLIVLSVSPGVRREMRETLQAVPSIWKLLVIFVGTQIVSLPLSANVSASLEKFVVAQISWTSIFFAAVYVFSKPGRFERWAAMAWGMAVIVGLIGIAEYARSRVPWAGHIPSFLKVEDEVVQKILTGAARAATGKYRLQSTFTTSLGLAEYIALVLPFVLHFVFDRFALWVRLAALATVPLLLWVIIGTDSRLGMVGFFLSLLFYMLFRAALRWRRAKDSLFGPSIVLAYPVIFTTFVVATFFVGRLRALVWGTGAQQASTDSRQVQIESGLPMVMNNPIGHGVGQAAETLGFANGYGTLTIDTYYLSIALEYGVIGFVIYYGMFLVGIWRAGGYGFKAEEREVGFLGPIAIALGNFFVIKAIFSQEDNHPIAFMLLGAVVALVHRMKRDAAAAPRRVPALLGKAPGRQRR